MGPYSTGQLDTADLGGLRGGKWTVAGQTNCAGGDGALASRMTDAPTHGDRLTGLTQKTAPHEQTGREIKDAWDSGKPASRARSRLVPGSELGGGWLVAGVMVGSSSSWFEPRDSGNWSKGSPPSVDNQQPRRQQPLSVLFFYPGSQVPF